MRKCKSTMCESDSLKNSTYCFEHYQKPESSPETALVCREKLLKLRDRAKRSRMSGAGWADVSTAMLSSWAYGAGRKSGFDEAGKDEGLSFTFNAAAMAMVISMMMTKEKGKKGEGDGKSL